MLYRRGANGTSKPVTAMKAPAQLTAEEVEKINDLVRELRQRVLTQTPQEIAAKSVRPRLARAIGRAFGRS